MRQCARISSGERKKNYLGEIARMLKQNFYFHVACDVHAQYVTIIMLILWSEVQNSSPPFVIFLALSLSLIVSKNIMIIMTVIII